MITKEMLQAELSKYDVLMAAKETDKACELLNRCLESARRDGNESIELTLLSELMGHYRQAHKEKEGFDAVRDGLYLLDKMGMEETADGATILINAATCLHSFGELNRAQELFLKAEKVYKNTIDSGDVRFAALYNNMASVYESGGQTEKALDYYKKALICNESPMDAAVTHVNMAGVYKIAGDEKNCEKELSAAMDIFNDPETLWDTYYAHTCGKCADAFFKLGHKDFADELIERAGIISEGT